MVVQAGLSDDAAALANSVFWAAFTIGRILGAAASHHVSPSSLLLGFTPLASPQVGTTAAEAVRSPGPGAGAGLQGKAKLEEDMEEVSMERHGLAKQLVVFFGAAGIGTGGGLEPAA
ncbi:hypothetical protein HaLaN_02707 [Haematococcus lacustris]|uniref:Uncharacterized protein n=1 Tax=Haematococcus lacustris TaxID=44745 RepID=A0A699YLQ8_HAELA|nr:hypothetical protein HaLaN_02707 [Haematococcus lacustris]